MIHEGTLAPETARARLLQTVGKIVGTESCALGAAAGRRLDTALVATANLPATANAAVDGYAVHADFLAAHPAHAFTVVGRAAAGRPFSGTIAEGEAVRIFTGAIMPHGPDAVAMHEQCRANETDGTVQIDTRLTPGSNSRPAGENIRIGETIIAAGTRLGPADIGIAAAAGHDALLVCRRLVVGLVSMGEEIVEPGTEPAFGQSFDSNRPMLRALVSADRHKVRDFPIVPDDADALITAYREAFASCDVVISSGGASDGDEDHTGSPARAWRRAGVLEAGDEARPAHGGWQPWQTAAVLSARQPGGSLCLLPAVDGTGTHRLGWRRAVRFCGFRCGPALTTGNMPKPMPVARP